MNRYRRFGIVCILPYFTVFFLFQLFPILYTFFLTFFSWDGFQPRVFIGLANYDRLITDPFFFQAVGNTFRIWLVSAIPQIGFALILGALFALRRFKGARFFQAIFYLPNLVTATSIAILFGLLMLVSAWVMGEASKMADENAQFV